MGGNQIEQHDQEVSLDPLDWESIRRLGHRMVDDMLGHLRTVPQGPVWRPMPPEIRAGFRAPVPMGSESLERIYQDFLSSVLPYGLGNLHPRFWGWVIGSGTPTAALAEFLAASLNTNAAGFGSAVVPLEEQVLAWLIEVMGMPPSSGGLLLSGASEANFIGLATALHARLGPSYRQEGVRCAAARPMVYASEESHFSVWRAVRLLGLGEESCRVIPSDRAHAIDLAALRAAIEDDRRRGLAPCIVVGTADTVGVGAFDDLDGLADVARDESLWFHVDGAFGAMLALSPAHAGRLRGMGRADSLAFDLHKWLHVPIEAACVLVRRAEDQRRAFAIDSSYTADMPSGPATQVNRFTNLGLQQSRGARAIKTWFAMREHGMRRLGECVAMNLAQAAYLAERICADRGLELLAPVAGPIVCFRMVPAMLPAAADRDAFNRALLELIQTRGIALPTGHRVHGTFAIRCAITNHRTTYADLDLFLEAVTTIGGELLARWSDAAEPSLHA